MQTFFLFMPGTTPGIFLFIVFGTTASSRQKIGALWDRIMPHRWRGLLPSSGNSRCLCCLGRKTTGSPTANAGRGKITIERSLTITSSDRFQGSGKLTDEELADPADIWMDEIPRRPGSAMSFDRMKPLPLAPHPPPSSRFRTFSAQTHGLSHAPLPDFTAVSPTSGRLTAIDEKSTIYGGSVSRPTTGDSSRLPDDYNRLDPEHSDDSGPILPIQRHEVRFAVDALNPGRAAAARDRQSKNFSRPRR